jgi:hypothetical protein
VASSGVHRKRLVRGASGMLLKPASVAALPPRPQHPRRSNTLLTVPPLIDGRDGRAGNDGYGYRLTHMNLHPGASTAPRDGAPASSAIEYPA